VGYVRQVLGTFLVRIVLIPVGLAYSVVAARWLGPADLGTFVALGTLIMTASQIGNLGLPIAVLRFAAAEPERTASLVANGRLSGLAAGSVALAILVTWARVSPASLGGVPARLVFVGGLALPFLFAANQFQSVVLGRQRVRQYNLMEALNRVLLLAGTVVVLVALGRGLTELVAVTAALAVVQFVAYQVLLGRDARRWRPDIPLLRSMVGFSFRAYLTVLFYFLVLRSDILLIHALLGASPTGIYNVAVLGADALFLLPAVAGLILFPKIASAGELRSSELTAQVCRHTAFFMLVACTATAVAAWWAVGWLFGAEYLGAVVPLWLLLPGIWMLSVQNVVYNDLAGRDYPLALPLSWGAALALNVGMNLALLPRVGVAAAALTSTAAYGLCFVLLGRAWLRRFPSYSWRDLLVVRREEARALTGRLRTALWGRDAATPHVPGDRS